MINSTQLHLKKRACGDISAKLYYVTSCFKVKCPLSDPKSNFKISQKHMKHNSFVTYYKLKWRWWLLMFNSGLKRKHDAKQTKGTPQVRGDKLAFKNAWYYWIFYIVKIKHINYINVRKNGITLDILSHSFLKWLRPWMQTLNNSLQIKIVVQRNTWK